ncbi:MAG: DUF1841 family protein [Betaproteobacteria bacterium]|nr:DUF1841 family protein [Betaproteobacteria bacterium]
MEPSMFNPSREEARRFFFDIWRKEREKALMTPLESMAWQVISHHPEYHSLLAQPERYLEREWFPEQGETNPFLHLGLHLAVEEQLSIDQPPGIRGAYDRLCQELKDEHAARHRLLEALAEVVWESQRHGTALDGRRYLQLIGTDPAP